MADRTSLGGIETDSVYVALDLETTGLEPNRDEIIEVGAVRFQGDVVVATFSKLVKPSQPLPIFIQHLTGITEADVEEAPLFTEISSDLVAFIDNCPIVGHNVSFDLGFLSRCGIEFEAPVFDTRQLASILLPNSEYSLKALARALEVPQPSQHRALADAITTQGVLLRLIELARKMDPGVIAELARLMAVAGSSLNELFDVIARMQAADGIDGEVGLGGVNLRALWKRMRPKREKNKRGSPLSDKRNKVDALAGIFGPEGALSTNFPSYEYRFEQESMASSVFDAFSNEHHLVVEAGTGVGKTMAYLVPAALFALENQISVVISTNTINLQEQLWSKDIPNVANMLNVTYPKSSSLCYATLKGRSNYLCMRKWSRLRSSSVLTRQEANFLGKLVCWLQTTDTGDLGELRMSRSDTGIWDRLSAQGSLECPAVKSPCFLQAARDRAGKVNLIVVNHALLLADIEKGGGLLPDYDYLIIDEAHRLEEEATRQFGGRIAYRQIEETLNAIDGPRGLMNEIEGAYAMAPSMRSTPGDAIGIANAISGLVGSARGEVGRFFRELNDHFDQYVDSDDPVRSQLRITDETRDHPDWETIQKEWVDISTMLDGITSNLYRASQNLAGFINRDSLNTDGIRAELSTKESELAELKTWIDTFLSDPTGEDVYWMENTPSEGVSLNRAPGHVGQLLRNKLFGKKAAIVLTSATLAVDNSFELIRERLGIDHAEEVLHGSPFDYENSTLVCVPNDMPAPSAAEYPDALGDSLIEVSSSTRGRVLALFTSYSSLRKISSRIRATLESNGITVLAQGVDGNPQQLLQRFVNSEKALLLGTTSFWEGIDLPGEALEVLVMTRLPFGVPTDPVFAARSEGYTNPFKEYAIPNAVLKFRQGFGRLIRTAKDKGVVVVLDKRILSQSYGANFLNALPPCRVEHPPIGRLGETIANWLGR